VLSLESRGISTKHILTDASLRNAMTVHRGFRRLDQPDSSHSGHRARRRAEAAHGRRLDRGEPQDSAAGRCAPMGPRSHPAVQVFSGGGVPEVMLHLRRAGC